MGTETTPKAMARANMRPIRSDSSLAVIGGATRKAKTRRTPQSTKRRTSLGAERGALVAAQGERATVLRTFVAPRRELKQQLLGAKSL
jgi:hypothetical protein